MVRFTSRVREFRGYFQNVPDSNTSRWISLCDEIKGKCRKKSGALYSAVLTELANLRDQAREIIGEDANGNDRDELAIKIYRHMTEYIIEQAKTLAYEEITNSAALRNHLTDKVLWVGLKIAASLLKSGVIIQEACDGFVDWGIELSDKSPLDDEFCLIPDDLQQMISEHRASLRKDPPKVVDVKEEEFDFGWLEQTLVGHFHEDAANILNSVIKELQISGTPEELQNHLVNMIGFDYIDIIPEIIKNKNRIVSEAIQISGAFATNDRVLRAPGVVQTTSEKKLRKLIEKDKKRERKFKAKGQKGGTNYEEDCDSILDVDALKEQRMAQMIDDATKASRFAKVEVKSYPFVFDKMADMARRNPIFITGKSLVLPEGAERKDTPEYEQINVPNEGNKLPPDIAKRFPRIPIDKLDNISKMVFKGMTSLNNIQSIVFDTASNSNENMLVAAPTGAGKTNVAMLTVLNIIRQHINVNGTLKLREFKIIYVAPMKALAAEITAKFQKMLQCLGVKVREYTGDMSLTRTEIEETQMLVTTPEKWDVLTRKRSQDVELMSKIKLMILDEIHLLQDSRGAVLEALVARTLRMVNTSQQMIRIVGLSATLPNYVDVAKFLRVNLDTGLFFFDGRFRPVPLDTIYVGVKSRGGRFAQLAVMDNRAYNIALGHIRKGKQVMIFVHSRNATAKTCESMMDLAVKEGTRKEFLPDPAHPRYHEFERRVRNSRCKELSKFFQFGFGCHHAGMQRPDRSLTEKLFDQGLIRVLCCTSTLAWGVNLPAYAVVIKGTEIYADGRYIDLSVLDVQQIFGRAGRPQFDTSGEATIITTHDKLVHYVSLMVRAAPIESQFLGKIADNLNAEIASGSVASVDDAVRWLSYTYLDIRIAKNPFHYGLNRENISDAGGIHNVKRQFIINAARELDKSRMIRFNEKTSSLACCDLGRTACNFYIRHDSIDIYNNGIDKTASISTMYLLDLIARSKEFEQMRVRNEEMDELDRLALESEFKIVSGVENVTGKVNCLIQAYLNGSYSRVSSLNSDLNYIDQNLGRITRALFEMVRKNGLCHLTNELHKMCLGMEHKMWWHWHPFYQFKTFVNKDSNRPAMDKIERKHMNLDRIREMPAKEIGQLVNNLKVAEYIKKMANKIPQISIQADVQPITRTIVRVVLKITIEMFVDDKSGGEPFWVWVEDSDNDRIYHNEHVLVSKKTILSRQPLDINFTVALPEKIPSAYMIKVVSDRWLGASETCSIDLRGLIMSELHPAHTELLDIQPLAISALKNPAFEALFSFSHFNPIQTQVFHCLYHHNVNCLIGAPTGSGKTVCAEMAMLKVFRDYPTGKCVYIAPMKALVRERMDDWSAKLKGLGKKLVEMTGDIAPDQKAIVSADIIITTPEKWDGISRSWQTRKYVRDVRLILIDEIHMLGEDRGPVLESIVTRTNFISAQTKSNLRIVGLSTALANARDLADWLGIKNFGLYNFKPSVRPVPMQIHVQGFPGKHYCPRMALMNKPAYHAIQEHSPTKPVLIFVSSRRQTRLTAMSLISLLAGNDNPKSWINYDLINELELDFLIDRVRDVNLRHTLEFGIGMHHAGLVEADRKIVEALFRERKIQILIATATLAWGVNLPAHMVIVKGTEHFDGKQMKFVDVGITDVLQMVGRAGRPQYDNDAVACVFIHDIKKNYYKKFIYEPFPVESNLLGVLPDHLNAEVVAGTVKSKQDAMNYLTWTYFFRRLLMNPNFYQLESLEGEAINEFLSELVEKTVAELEKSGVLEVDEDDNNLLFATSLGQLASYYYLRHETARHFCHTFNKNMSSEDLLVLLTEATEFAELPVRHNEDQENEHLAKQVPIEVDNRHYERPEVKTHLLLQVHMNRGTLPSSDYLLDTKTVMDNAARVLQAMIDIAVELGYLANSIRLMRLMQGISQGRWPGDDPFITIPHVDQKRADYLRTGLKVTCMGDLVFRKPSDKNKLLESIGLQGGELKKAHEFVNGLPAIRIDLGLAGDTKDEVLKIPDSFFTADFRNEKSWLKLPKGEELVLQVRMTCSHRGKSIYAQTPRYPKPKLEGWFILIGDAESGELIALKKVNQFRGQCKTEMVFFEVPETKSILTLYIISDSYLGLDQCFDIRIDPQDA